MKKINLFATLLVAVLCFAVSSCAGDQLSKAVEEANKQCPIELAPGITMSSISEDGAAVCYNYTVNTELYPLDALQQAYTVPGAHKNLIEQLRSEKETAQFIDLVKAAGKNVKLVFEGADGSSFEEVIENSEF